MDMIPTYTVSSDLEGTTLFRNAFTGAIIDPHHCCTCFKVNADNPRCDFHHPLRPPDWLTDGSIP